MVPELNAQAWTPMQASFPTVPLFSKQASTPTQAPFPMLAPV
jgi:hypothetical protein